MRLIRLLAALAVPAVSVLALAAPATAATPTTGHSGSNNVTTLATFDHSAGETPENIVITGHEVVVSLAFASTVAVLDHSGRRVQSLRLDTASGFIAGLALDHRRHALAIGVSSPDAAAAGVYEASFNRGRLGTPTRLAALPGGAFPNGLALDPAGDLYAADSLLGTIWRVPAKAPAAAPAQAWLNDPLLRPGPAGLPGANGLKYRRKGSLYVSNAGRATLLATPLTGRQARTVVVVRDDLRIDDFTFDQGGTLYAALNQANEVVRRPLRPQDGPVKVLATTADGVHNPSAPAFADHERGGHCGDGMLYVTEGAFDGPTPTTVGATDSATPIALRMQACPPNSWSRPDIRRSWDRGRPLSGRHRPAARSAGGRPSTTPTRPPSRERP
jgi:hypothetical protein